jgi:hypothetical protein
MRALTLSSPLPWGFYLGSVEAGPGSGSRWRGKVYTLPAEQRSGTRCGRPDAPDCRMGDESTSANGNGRGVRGSATPAGGSLGAPRTGGKMRGPADGSAGGALPLASLPGGPDVPERERLYPAPGKEYGPCEPRGRLHFGRPRSGAAAGWCPTGGNLRRITRTTHYGVCGGPRATAALLLKIARRPAHPDECLLSETEKTPRIASSPSFRACYRRRPAAMERPCVRRRRHCGAREGMAGSTCSCKTKQSWGLGVPFVTSPDPGGVPTASTPPLNPKWTPSRQRAQPGPFVGPRADGSSSTRRRGGLPCWRRVLPRKSVASS